MNGTDSKQYGHKKLPTSRGGDHGQVTCQEEGKQRISKNYKPWLPTKTPHFISWHAGQTSKTSQFTDSNQDPCGESPDTRQWLDKSVHNVTLSSIQGLWASDKFKFRLSFCQFPHLQNRLDQICCFYLMLFGILNLWIVVTGMILDWLENIEMS